MIKQCIICGRDFEPDVYHPYQKYCSRRCQMRSRYLRCGEKIREQSRAYRQAHRDEINAYNRYCKRICGRNRQ